MRTLSSVSLATLLLGAALMGQDSRPTSAPSAPRPNIVVLYSDDAGYADFGFQEAPAPELAKRTPHIDSIAKAGLRFTSAYMSGAVCSPSRAGLMTGRYQQRFGHERNIPPGYMQGGMSLREKTIADRLKARGYHTGLVGKWHLGYPADYHPNKRGFDWFYGLLQGSRPYVAMKKPTPHRVIQENGEATDEGGYVTDRFGDAAVRYLETRAKAESPQPFFLFVSFTSPHGPLQAKAEDLETLKDIKRPRRRRYAGLIKSLDDNVGKILAALDRLELAEDTLVVFTNDNGGQTQTGAVNTPLRGRKGMVFEGGVRVPMCMRWPGRIAAASSIDSPVIALDLLPTFVALAGGERLGKGASDGVDLSPLLLGKETELPERSLFWRTQGSKGPVAMRKGRYKLVHLRTAEQAAPMLFDLSRDISESEDLAEEEGGRVGELLAELERWEAGLVEPLWGRAPRRRKK